MRAQAQRGQRRAAREAAAVFEPWSILLRRGSCAFVDTGAASLRIPTRRASSIHRTGVRLRGRRLVLGQPATEHAAREDADEATVFDDRHALEVVRLER